MGVRETLNQNKTIGVAAIIVLIAGAAGAMYWTNSSAIPAPLKTAFYSDDDGKTFYPDDTSRISPYDHNGKQAVRVTVFRWGNGAPFVGYMTRLNESGRKRMQELSALPDTAANDAARGAISTKTTEFKRPGEEKWQPIGSPGATADMNPAPPPGETGDLTSVDP
jgi:hypothetical protein